MSVWSKKKKTRTEISAKISLNKYFLPSWLWLHEMPACKSNDAKQQQQHVKPLKQPICSALCLYFFLSFYCFAVSVVACVDALIYLYLCVNRAVFSEFDGNMVKWYVCVCVKIEKRREAMVRIKIYLSNAQSV